MELKMPETPEFTNHAQLNVAVVAYLGLQVVFSYLNQHGVTLAGQEQMLTYLGAYAAGALTPPTKGV